jgi:hypothetical protein
MREHSDSNEALLSAIGGLMHESKAVSIRVSRRRNGSKCTGSGEGRALGLRAALRRQARARVGARGRPMRGAGGVAPAGR